MTVYFVKRLAITRTVYPSPANSSRDHGDVKQPDIQGTPSHSSHRVLFLGGCRCPSPLSRRSRTSSRTPPCCATTSNMLDAMHARHVPTVACYLLVILALVRSASADAPERILVCLSRSRNAPPMPRRPLYVSALQGLARHGRSLTSRRTYQIRCLI